MKTEMSDNQMSFFRFQITGDGKPPIMRTLFIIYSGDKCEHTTDI